VNTLILCLGPILFIVLLAIRECGMKDRLCPHCHGTGDDGSSTMDFGGMARCAYCDGTGYQR